MGLKKRIYYGFDDYKGPAIPRAPRSIRKRAYSKNTAEHNHISAFELLATVAGKLLQESESSASSNADSVNKQSSFSIDMIKKEKVVESLAEAEFINQDICDKKVLAAGIASRDFTRSYTSRGFPLRTGDSFLECASIITSSSHPKKPNGAANLDKIRSRDASESDEIAKKVVKVSPDHDGESHDSNIENGLGRQAESDSYETKDLKVAHGRNSVRTTFHSGRKVELPLCKHPVTGSYLSRHRSNVSLGSKDDDENFSACYPDTKVKAFKAHSRIGDHRIRKLLKSKYWKVASKFKNYEASNAGGVKAVYHKRKTCYAHRSSMTENFLKRRKLFDQRSVVTTDGGFSVKTFCNSSELRLSGDKNGSTESLQGVKLSIQSFKIPELLIEIPETATVGLLKRTVMEAVTSMLEGGLRVGVLLRGKKIRDDSRTLRQTGISHNDNVDALGFSLEPSSSEAPLLLSSEDPPISLECNASQPLVRSSASPISNISPDLPFVKTLGKDIESHQDYLASPTNILTDNTVPESKALVAVPPTSMEPLPVTPINQRSRRPEFTQRRTRRPFSVSEVEALVHAVEELGTGRWRDVKLRAFEDANHRTYVDLKDKWKTLVHTAKISPQQRRGEPVPQQLLDRVLAAHAYWSQYHEKQQGKLLCGTLKLTESQAESVGA